MKLGLWYMNTFHTNADAIIHLCPNVDDGVGNRSL